MRYVTLEQLRPGMTVGKPFYGHMGGMLLQKGYGLTPTIISRLHEKKYSGQRWRTEPRRMPNCGNIFLQTI